MRKMMFLALALAVGLGLASIPAAQAFTLSQVNNFTDPVGGLVWQNWNDTPTFASVAPVPGYGNNKENQIRWGIPAEFGDKSGLGFTGISPPDKVFAANTPFELGQLRHFNNPIYAEAQGFVSTVDLKISTAFTDPAGATPSFTFNLMVNETLNSTGNPFLDRDFINFPNTFPAEKFTVGSTEYTLHLLGFGPNAGNLVSVFESPEGTTNSVRLWAELTEAPVPLPGAVFLFGSGLAGLAMLRRWR